VTAVTSLRQVCLYSDSRCIQFRCLPDASPKLLSAHWTGWPLTLFRPKTYPYTSALDGAEKKRLTSIFAGRVTSSFARNYRSPHHRGELDLVGWDKDVLCFIEVKTRTTRDFKPAEAAVDRDKQRELRMMARDFLRHTPPSCQWRFDVLATYYEAGGGAVFELFQNAFSVSLSYNH
jgi:Holliday junction resolvase-like predicted endonuclease